MVRSWNRNRPQGRLSLSGSNVDPIRQRRSARLQQLSSSSQNDARQQDQPVRDAARAAPLQNESLASQPVEAGDASSANNSALDSAQPKHPEPANRKRERSTESNHSPQKRSKIANPSESILKTQRSTKTELLPRDSPIDTDQSAEIKGHDASIERAHAYPEAGRTTKAEPHTLNPSSDTSPIVRFGQNTDNDGKKPDREDVDAHLTFDAKTPSIVPTGPRLADGALYDVYRSSSGLSNGTQENHASSTHGKHSPEDPDQPMQRPVRQDNVRTRWGPPLESRFPMDPHALPGKMQAHRVRRDQNLDHSQGKPTNSGRREDHGAFRAVKLLKNPELQKNLAEFHNKQSLVVGRELMQAAYNHRSEDLYNKDDGWLKNAAESRKAGRKEIALVINFNMTVPRADPRLTHKEDVWWTPGADGTNNLTKREAGVVFWNGDTKLIKCFTTKSNTDWNRLRESGDLNNYMQAIRWPQEKDVVPEKGVYGVFYFEADDVKGWDWNIDGPRLMHTMGFYEHPHGMAYRYLGKPHDHYDEQLVQEVWDMSSAQAIKTSSAVFDERRADPGWFSRLRGVGQSALDVDTVVEKSRALPLENNGESHQPGEASNPKPPANVDSGSAFYTRPGAPEQDLDELLKLESLYNN